MGGLSFWHLLIIVAVVLLVFGTGRISGVMGDLAKGIKNFKQGMKDEETPQASKSLPSESGKKEGVNS